MNDLAGSTFVFIGRPGSGKGTQSELFVKDLEGEGYDVLRLTVGDLGRALGARQTLIGAWAKTMLDKGAAFPSWLAFTLLVDELAESLKDAKQVVVLDGAPRRLFEAKSLDELMTDLGRPAPRAIYIDISEEESRTRLAARMRGDDTPDAIENRLSWFATEVMPVIEYYDGRLVRIMGEGEIATVQESLAASV